MATKTLQIVGQLGDKIYKQNEAPIDAPDGTLWVDMDAESAGGSSGGGIQPNFCVVGGTVEPENPSENMIWVKTGVEISDVVFNANEPIFQVEGMVWVITGDMSYVSFNALKINNLYIDPQYPLDAKQYTNGSWIDVEAVSYQGGRWLRWVNGLYIYKFGNEYADITGGFNIVKATVGHNLNSNTKKYDTNLTIHANSNTSGCFVTKWKIDLTEYKRLCANIVSTTGKLAIGVSSSSSSPFDSFNGSKYVSDSGVVTLDISSIEDEHFICVGAWANTGDTTVTAKIDEIWLEK